MLAAPAQNEFVSLISSTMTNKNDDTSWPGDPDFLEDKFVRFSYRFKFDDNEAFDDDVIDFGEFKVLIDSMSYPYLYGSTLDFVEDLSGAKFVIENPNAKTTCGCGESFTV